ncbi:glycosyltransferase, partial [Acinetobacter baumannii]
TMYSHYYGFICAIIKKDFKLVCTEHGTYNKKLKIYTRMYLFKLLNFYSDIVTNVSNVSSQSYIDQKIVSKNKIKTLYNGIDVKKYQYNSNARKKIRSELNICDDTILLGYIGRLSEEKNIINLLNSLKYIGNNYRLIIVGDGPLKEDILKYIIDFNLSEKILYLGKKENIPDYYSAIDLLVLPSDTEGLPTVVLEAMAAECLVVTTNCGGVKEIFPIDYNYIVDVKDHLKLSQAINEILNTSNEEKNKIRKICFDRVKNEFSIEKANSNWLRLYND